MRPSPVVVAEFVAGSVPVAAPADLAPHVVEHRSDTGRDWRLRVGLDVRHTDDVVAAFGAWRSSWTRWRRLGVLSTAMRLAARDRTLDSHITWAPPRRTRSVVGVVHPASHQRVGEQLARLRACLADSTERGHGLVAFAADGTRALQRTWSVPGGAELLVASADLEVWLHPTSGVVVTTGALPETPRLTGVHEVAVAGGRVNVQTRSGRTALGLDLAGPLLWLAPGEPRWRAIEIPAALVWAEIIDGLSAACAEAAAANVAVSLRAVDGWTPTAADG